MQGAFEVQIGPDANGLAKKVQLEENRSLATVGTVE